MFKKALNNHHVSFLVTPKHINIACPAFIHRAGTSGLIAISKKTQKGGCDSCAFEVLSYNELIAALEFLSAINMAFDGGGL